MHPFSVPEPGPRYIHHCGLCGRQRGRIQLVIVDDERGFVAYMKCKDEKDCAANMGVPAL